MKRKLDRRRKGVVMLMFGAMMLFVLCPAVGLAIDMGVAYAAKARLQSASDGAVIAATRSLNRGLNDAARQAAASETAQRFFTANLKDGWLGISNPVATVTFPAAPPKTTLVQVNTTVQLSTYFLRLLGTTSVTMRTASAAQRRDVNIMLVLDRSGSMAASGSCAPMTEAAKSFVLTFQDGRDKVGLVTFGTSYRVDKQMGPNFRTSGTDIITIIDNINCVGSTNSAAAYSLAYDQLVAANEPGVLNAILIFTDGLPNTVTMPRVLMAASGTCSSKGNRFGAIGQAGGIFQPIAPSLPPVITDPMVSSNSSGCAFASDPSIGGIASDAVALTRSAADGNSGDSSGEAGDTIAGGLGAGHGNGWGGGRRWDNWPADQDAFGNSLNGYKSVVTDGNGRLTLDANNVTNASINAMTNAAVRIRADSAARGLDVTTYVIGLGDFSSADTVEILDRVSNAPSSPVHDPTKPIGLTIYAAVAGELEAAFSLVASEMVRLSM